MYFKLSYKYLAMKDIAKIGFLKVESFLGVRSFLEVESPFNLSILLSIREKS